MFYPDASLNKKKTAAAIIFISKPLQFNNFKKDFSDQNIRIFENQKAFGKA